MRPYRTPAFVLLSLFLLASVAGAADLGPKVHLDVQEFRLDNGMLFLVVERPTTPQVACRLAIRAGAALEERGKTGIAHMLEHMMFKGTKNLGTLDVGKDQALQERIETAYQAVLEERRKRHPDQALIENKLDEMEELRSEVKEIFVPQAFSSQLEKNGAVDVNAFTTEDQTQYLMSVPSDMLEQWFSIQSEQVFEPAWREFYVEKEVIQREWAYREVNDPEGMAWLDLNATAYSAHPYRNPTIGWKSDIEDYSTLDAIAFHRRYYNPANAVCVLVGDVTVDRARRLAEIYFARYPGGERAPEEVTKEPFQEGPRKSIRFLKGARTPLVRIGFHGARMEADDFCALDALTMVLSHGRGARMTQNIVDAGLAVEAWAYNPDNRYGGLIVLGGSPKEPESLAQESLPEMERRAAYMDACQSLETMLLAEADRLKTEPVSPRELRRIKKLNQREFLDRMRSNEALAGSLATLEVQIGWRYALTYLDKIESVSADDIVRVARKYLRNDNKTTAYVIPGGPPEEAPEPYEEIRTAGKTAAGKVPQPADMENHSAYPTPPGWKHPLSFARTPEKIVYPKAETEKVQGASLFYLPDRELPLVDLMLLVKAGAVDVSEEKTGLTDILEECLMRGGTQTRAPSEVAMVLDENAIQLSVSISDEVTAITLSVIKEDWETGLALLEEVLARPGFNPKVLQVVKDEALTDLRREGEDAQAVAQREARIWHFQGHPYGRDPLLGLRTIPAISVGDLKAFLSDYFVPSNMVAVVAGDLSMQDVSTGLARLFSALPEGPSPGRDLAEPAHTPPVLASIHKPGQVQSQVSLILPSLKRTEPGFWKMALLTEILGGSDSLMYTRLRDDLGLVYAAGFYQTYKWKAGLLVGYLGCKADQTGRAIQETLDLMAGLRTGIPATALEQKRLDVLNGFVFNVDSPAELVEVYGHYYIRGEPLDTLERIQEAYMAASSAELEDLARRYLDAGRVQIFVVADGETTLKKSDGTNVTLEQTLKTLAKTLNLPYREIQLR